MIIIALLRARWRDKHQYVIFFKGAEIMTRLAKRGVWVLASFVLLLCAVVTGMLISTFLMFPPQGRIYNCNNFDDDVFRIVQQAAKIKMTEGVVLEKAAIIGGADYSLILKLKVPVSKLESLVSSFNFSYRYEQPRGGMAETELTYRQGWGFDSKRICFVFTDEHEFRKVYVCGSSVLCYEIYLICHCDEMLCSELVSRFK